MVLPAYGGGDRATALAFDSSSGMMVAARRKRRMSAMRRGSRPCASRPSDAASDGAEICRSARWLVVRNLRGSGTAVRILVRDDERSGRAPRRRSHRRAAEHNASIAARASSEHAGLAQHAHAARHAARAGAVARIVSRGVP
jgi:hypothetical protein